MLYSTPTTMVKKKITKNEFFCGQIQKSSISRCRRTNRHHPVRRFRSGDLNHVVTGFTCIELHLARFATARLAKAVISPLKTRSIAIGGEFFAAESPNWDPWALQAPYSRKDATLFNSGTLNQFRSWSVNCRSCGPEVP